jgi:hypothetical protein
MGYILRQLRTARAPGGGFFFETVIHHANASANGKQKLSLDLDVILQNALIKIYLKPAAFCLHSSVSNIFLVN